jgi:hypothetical protein
MIRCLYQSAAISSVTNFKYAASSGVLNSDYVVKIRAFLHPLIYTRTEDLLHALESGP